MSIRSNTRIYEFKRPNTGQLSGYDVSIPGFDPVFLLDDLSRINCPKKIYLYNIKGLSDFIPRTKLIYPKSYSMSLKSEYLKFSRDYYQFRLSFSKILFSVLQSSEKFINKSEREFGLITRDIIDNIIQDDFEFVNKKMRLLFSRLYSEDKFESVDESSVMLNMQIFNPTISFQIPPGIHLESNPNSADNQFKFIWEGNFAGLGLIEELNCNSQEIVGYEFISKDFYSNNTDPLFENHFEWMIIVPRLFNLWLQRLALATLPNSHYNMTLNHRFEPYSLNSRKFQDSPKDFSDYDIRLETLDHTYTEIDLLKHFTKPERTLAQSLIFTKLCNTNRAYLSKLFFEECPMIKIDRNLGFDGTKNYNTRNAFCSMANYCQLRDSIKKESEKGINNIVVYPNPYSEGMVNRLHFYLKNEITMKSLNFYRLNEFIFNYLQDLQSNVEVFLGELSFEPTSDSYYFHPINHPDNIIEKHEYTFIPWTPFIFSINEILHLERENTRLKVIFNAEREKKRIIYTKYFPNGLNQILVILGSPPGLKHVDLIKRQQFGLWKSVYFNPIKEKEHKNAQEIVDEITTGRLKNRERRSGMVIFGNDEPAKYSE